VLRLMRQLTSLDAQFLALENARQTGHVAGLAIYDTSTAPNGRLSCAEMKELIASRLHLLPPLRWRLVEVPLGADYPYWVDDTDFDLDFHVRELALPPPGDGTQLAEQVARLHSRPLDRGRPLWEIYVISGLATGDTERCDAPMIGEHHRGHGFEETNAPFDAIAAVMLAAAAGAAPDAE